MHLASRHTRIEWAFLAAMAVLCTGLSILQYHWTGELARAEIAQLRSNLNEQSRLLVQSFDDELTAASARLLPTPGEIDELGRDAAFAERWRKWQATNPRPIFSRMALAIPSPNGINLVALDSKSQALAPLPWPRNWDDLRDHLGRRGGGPPERVPPGRPDANRPPRPGDPGERRDRPPPPRGVQPPYLDRFGTLLNFPIPGGAPRDDGSPERGWVILELDSAFLTKEWLPQLIRQYLDADGKGLDDTVISAPGSNQPQFFSLRSGNASGQPDVALEFNHLGHAAANPRGPLRAAWLLEVWHRPGAFEAMVNTTRRRNLAIAMGLNLLIIAAGVFLVRHTRQSRRLAETQMNFVASVSHELRTPLTVIRGAAHNLERGVVQDPAKVGQYLRLIQSHADQLGSMVEQVLAYAGANKAPALMARQEVAIKEVLSEAIADAGQETAGTPCEVDFTAPQNLPSIHGDPLALRRAFQNLLANAVKHGGEGGWIGVTVRATNGSEPPAIEVQVSDRGPGIPEKEQAEIFKPFMRGARAQSRQLRGSGLGLSLVREIVEAHGGTVAVSSQPGSGATFTVRLPLS
ncbi:MAG TPA: HAMP domain-containing sensor histidine kinase [Chthoniobacter sp.]|nr:HAMP domain-containing sensor histidine kinase [Chthoniobacter sp.]